MPADPIERSLCIQWVFFQIGSVGPMFGQFGHFFRFARETCKDPYPVERYTTETKRLLGVLEQRLDGRDYIVGGDYSIADIAIFPWVRTLNGFYEAGEQVGYDDYKRVVAWVDRCVARPSDCDRPRGLRAPAARRLGAPRAADPLGSSSRA